MQKRELNLNVYEASIKRIKYIFDNFPKIYISFSGGKDSTVMLHLVMKEAIKRNKKVGLLFVDLEGQYKLTIEHIKKCCELYRNNLEIFWICLSMSLRNAVSQYEPKWICWDKSKESDWIRNLPELGIIDEKYFSFFYKGMEFEEFVSKFGKWYGKGKLTACFVGIRTDESLNRWRTIASDKKQKIDNKCYTTWIGEGLYNIYPIYDWKTKDIWIYHGKNKNLPYNKLYDRMYQAGLTISQMRICQPYGDDQRKGLWLFHIIEPETWTKIIKRVNGANQGALYAKNNGNILGNRIITKPDKHTWKSFSLLLLNSMPSITKEHFENKIAVFIQWWKSKGYEEIPDDGELTKEAPSWKRICKALLRNDYWCKGLSFSQTKHDAYEKYKKLMRKKRAKWNVI